MKKNKTKRTIYMRIFCAFFATYLALMTGFSIFLISREKKVESLELRAFALQVNNAVEDVLQDHIDSNNQVTDIAKVKKEFVRKSSLFTLLGTEAAIFTGDYKLIFNTNDYWLCSYTEYSEGNRNYTGYGYLNPRHWFNEKEITELENYLYANPKAEKAGDLSGYSVTLEGFWVDNEMIIPDKISVIAMYAETFDENGNASSSSGTRQNDGVYISGYKNTKGLPYFQHGSIQPNNNSYRNSEKQVKLRNMVLDQEKLKEAVKQLGNVSYERVNLLTYRYYLPMPYRNTVKMTDNHNYYSEFWTVIARDVNLLDKCAGTLAFVWGSCFITFVIVAMILSRQTYKTYQKREELERQRKETTNALAHDLKTPLSIISGYAQNLIENIHTEKRKYYAGNIQANVNRMDKIIREMLELSRLESDLFPIKLEDVSLGEVCVEIINRYNQVCDEKNILTSLEGDAVIKVDHSLIERVIDNFFINALDSTPEGGTIRIKILDNTLELYNSGSRISEEKMNEIWLPYKKAELSRSNTKGTGLGLSISRTILELYKFPYGAKNSDDGVVFWFKFT
ncbi:Histidine kinase-, DNA gyrase B-, and HSP90-like ATPase [Desulfotomaculum arcticum]|uniref:histidine kinase n=1 Tax=Desulfotruncus arcticus DSM 17038 TaxID=1121424 RepID=A0A1I2SPI4_9FIRM|nr:HAMP domain-containing sensor histidine kinase [Desulfotruncus arcticus]SFG54714.1 Histidine kinase-, DNA gyrase B-, and HSP90-like ATPase [Desulfotomaculum arcticum] [Desulfotruncus arcticus DSM 17038]